MWRLPFSQLAPINLHSGWDGVARQREYHAHRTSECRDVPCCVFMFGRTCRKEHKNGEVTTGVLGSDRGLEIRRRGRCTWPDNTRKEKRVKKEEAAELSVLSVDQFFCKSANGEKGGDHVGKVEVL
jgi:hypothetical protein